MQQNWERGKFVDLIINKIVKHSKHYHPPSPIAMLGEKVFFWIEWPTVVSFFQDSQFLNSWYRYSLIIQLKIVERVPVQPWNSGHLEKVWKNMIFQTQIYDDTPQEGSKKGKTLQIKHIIYLINLTNEPDSSSKNILSDKKNSTHNQNLFNLCLSQIPM